MIDEETGEIIPIKRPFVRTPYNYDRNMESYMSGLRCEDPSLAQQNAKEDADINTLVRKFGITGQMPMLDKLPMEGDYENVGDFKTAMDAIIQAQETFMQLPADLRYRFHNDPQEFLEFTTNEANREEIKKLGLLKPEKEAMAPIEVRLAKEPEEKPPAT